MLLSKKSLKSCKLYLILDTEVHSFDKLFCIAQQSIPAGVDIIQLRDKNGLAKDILEFSKRILKLTRNKIPFIINDRVDLAMMAGANGVHLGQDDIPLKVARRMMGAKAIIGVSCQTFEHAKKAEREGADYIGFGSVFKTLTKPQRDPMDLNLLKKVINEIRVPLFAIGGINLSNIRELSDIGVRRFAICRAISEMENVGATIKCFRKVIE